MKVLTLGLFLLLTLSVATVPTVFADGDEWDDDDEAEYKRGANEMTREQEYDDDDEEGLALGGVSDAILYGTIAVIVGSVGYTGYKIFKAKGPKLTSR